MAVGGQALPVVCPGIHDPQLTARFLQSLSRELGGLPPLRVFPAPSSPPYSPWHVWQFLERQGDGPLIFISFSAGVVGGIGAAWMWQQWGREVKAFIALDGWGVPLAGNFPIYRLSHDEFTHRSSACWGRGRESFFADPPVEHLKLWHSPHEVEGWKVGLTGEGREGKTRTTAATFLAELLSLLGCKL